MLMWNKTTPDDFYSNDATHLLEVSLSVSHNTI